MLVMFYSPFPTLESARAAAHVLLEQRVVACCNLLPGVESHFIWDGVVTESQEVVLIAKTLPELAERVRYLLAAQHPYECPAILSFSAEVNPYFFAWAASAVASEPSR